MTVAWISNFPGEWLSDIPESLRSLPREHPATWEMVLLTEFERNPSLRLHIIILRKNISRSFSFQRNGVTFHLLKYRGGTRASTLFWADTWLIRRALRQIKPDLVHAWGSEQGAALVASRLPFPYLVTVLGLLQWYKDVGPMPAYHKFGAWIEKISLPKAKHVSTESRFAVRYLQDNYPRLIVHQIEHAPNWVFHQVQRRPMSGPIRFLTNGAISHRKGTDLFLMALNELVTEFDFQATVIGSPNEAFIAPVLAGLSPELRKRILFKSNLTAAEVARELSAATILLLPTGRILAPMPSKKPSPPVCPWWRRTWEESPIMWSPARTGFSSPRATRRSSCPRSNRLSPTRFFRAAWSRLPPSKKAVNTSPRPEWPKASFPPIKTSKTVESILLIFAALARNLGK